MSTLQKHEILAIQVDIVKKILEAIEEHYDLHYGETYIDPNDFYWLVEDFLPPKDQIDDYNGDKITQLIDHTEPARSIVICLTAGEDLVFKGWHRQDLDDEHPNWHYYQTTENLIIHVRKEHIVAVVETVPCNKI